MASSIINIVLKKTITIISPWLKSTVLNCISPYIPDYDILEFLATLPHVVTHILCKTDDIKDPGSKGFEVKIKRQIHTIFVVHKDGNFFAYYNKCPHTGANLEWQEDQFLDLDNALIQCTTHDALFMIDSGECIAGPCVGELLQSLPLIIKDDELYLNI